MRIAMLAVCALASLASFGKQSYSGRHIFIRDGHGIRIDAADVRARHETNYAVVCFNAVDGMSINDVTPVFSAMGAKLVKREVIDERTWGYVFDVTQVMPIMVFDTCPGVMVNKDGAWQKTDVTLKFRKPTVFWMPKTSPRGRNRRLQ